MSNILLVDDDPTVLKLLESILKKQNHVPVAVSNVFDARAKLKEQPFDLIVCDAMMPGISGFQFVQTLRMDASTRDLPFLFLTGRRRKRDVIKAYESGANDYLIKPLDIKLFNLKVKNLLTAEKSQARPLRVPMQEKAEWICPMDIIGVSNSEVFIRSQVELEHDVKIRIQSEIFSKIGIIPPFLIVKTCIADAQGFTITALFDGLSKKELGLVDQWLRKAA